MFKNTDSRFIQPLSLLQKKSVKHIHCIISLICDHSDCTVNIDTYISDNSLRFSFEEMHGDEFPTRILENFISWEPWLKGHAR